MSGSGRQIVVVLRRGASERRLREVLAWIRSLVPAAMLLVAPGATAPSIRAALDTVEATVITIDVEAVQSGPLAVAAALVGGHRA